MVGYCQMYSWHIVIFNTCIHIAGNLNTEQKLMAFANPFIGISPLPVKNDFYFKLFIENIETFP